MAPGENPNLTARLGGGGPIDFRSEPGDGAAPLSIVLGTPDVGALKHGRAMLEHIRQAARRLPKEEAVRELGRMVLLFRQVTLRSPDFHRAMNALHAAGAVELIRRILAPIAAHRPRGRPHADTLSLMRAVRQELEQEGSAKAAVAALKRRGAKVAHGIGQHRMENAFAALKQEAAWARAHYLPAPCLMDRCWAPPGAASKPSAVDRAYDALAAMYAQSMTRDEKLTFLAAFKAYEAGGPPPPLPTVPDHVEDLRVRVTNVDVDAVKLVGDDATSRGR